MVIKVVASLLLAGVAFGQIPEDQLRSKIQGIHYLRLAEMPRVQGDVHLKVSDGVVSLLSGPALLTQTAVEGTKSFVSLLGGGDFDVTYHFGFVFVDRMKRTTIKKGNTFERSLLRLVGLKTEKVVLVCEDGPDPLSDFKIADANIEIWVSGASHCVQTETGDFI